MVQHKFWQKTHQLKWHTWIKRKTCSSVLLITYTLIWKHSGARYDSVPGLGLIFCLLLADRSIFQYMALPYNIPMAVHREGSLCFIHIILLLINFCLTWGNCQYEVACLCRSLQVHCQTNSETEVGFLFPIRHICIQSVHSCCSLWKSYLLPYKSAQVLIYIRISGPFFDGGTSPALPDILGAK